MASVYIISENGKLTKSDETIVFIQPDGGKTILFPYKTEHLVIMGNVTVSGDALRILTKYKIPVTFLSSNGKFNGKLSFGESKNVFLRQKQYLTLNNQKKSLSIAKNIVTGKIKNEITFMQRIKRKLSTPQEKLFEDSITSIKNQLEKVAGCNSMQSLRGLEGMAARNYFNVFGFNIFPEWAEFKSRSKNPPKSNVNAVLSFLYTLLSYRVESAIDAQGLDVCCGNLHALNYGKSALVYDLMEEFRTPIADSICCNLFNMGTLKEDDFETVEYSTQSDKFPLELEEGSESSDEKTESVKGVLLTKEGIKKVICAFEEKLDTLIFYQPLEKKLSYIKIIFAQAEHYKRVINNEERMYTSYSFK